MMTNKAIIYILDDLGCEVSEVNKLADLNCDQDNQVTE